MHIDLYIRSTDTQVYTVYLKDVLDFCELDESLKAYKKEQAKRLPRGVAGVAYGNPAHLLDAAHYVKQALNLISDGSVRNSFNKTQLITRLDSGVDEEATFMSDMSEILRSFQSRDID